MGSGLFQTERTVPGRDGQERSWCIVETERPVWLEHSEGVAERDEAERRHLGKPAVH